MDIAKKILLGAVGLVMAVGFIAIVVKQYNSGRNSISSSTAQYNQVVSGYDDISYSFYADGGSASGQEVLSLVKALPTKQDGVTILVKTGANTTGVSYTADNTKAGEGGAVSAAVQKAEKKGDVDYINPTAVFGAEVKKDKNGIVEKITFTQK